MTRKTTENKFHFHSLSPVSDEEKHKHYCDALAWALKNRNEKDIKNIALTGNYGSGKSSILKTFQERQMEGLKFLNISLATFKEEKIRKPKTSVEEESNISNNTKREKLSEATENSSKSENDKDILTKNDQLRLIELSILQQIIYHEKNKNIPFSRFKKIRGIKPDKIRSVTREVFGIVCSFYLLFFFDNIRELFSLPEPKPWFEYSSKALVLSLFLILFYLILKRIIKFSQRLTISKLNFQNLEIQVEKSQDKSILNNHLDEILYFFEATKYNVVIIEDLDRFEQTEIFTKLREINLLINNSKPINRRVVFIYAVRDEMFIDNDRTKFFDFIIPIIPVINYSNSNEQLTKALKEFGYLISSDLIDKVAFYVDDMRLLYNIVNEFHIYFQKFQENRYRNKLFAIIVYKNLYPDDFVRLGRNEGILYKNLVENKTPWVKGAVEEIEKENITLKNEIKELEEVLPKNIDELKRIYLLEYLKRTPGLWAFRIGDKNYSIEEMLYGENFEMLFKNSATYKILYQNGFHPFSFKFREVEEQIDSENSYIERKSQLHQINSGRIAVKRSKLKINEEKIVNIKGTKMKNLLKEKKLSILLNPTKQEQLITLLIRNGYIAEDYLNYISYFYPGSITEKDHWFLMNVRNETPSDFEYKLDEVGNVIKKISDSEFEKSYVLNYNLVNYLFEVRGYGSKKDIILKQLSNESEDSVKFVKSYIEKGKDVASFIKDLCNTWISIWSYIEQDVSLSDEKKLSYYILILNKAEVGDIKKIALNSGLETFICNKPDFLTLIEEPKKLIDIINLFDAKFTSLNFDGVSEDIKKHVYENNNYELNPHMLDLMIKTFGELNKENFNNSNYTAIQLSKCESLINYVDNNISKYIDSVYLKLENNKEEQLNYLVDLLNHSEILKSDKERILLWTNTVIKDISELETTSELIDFLLENYKAEANWSNLVYVYEQKGNSFPEILNDFINDANNANTLSSQPFYNDNENHKDFRAAFLLNNSIDDMLYSSYIEAFPVSYIELNFKNLSKGKVKVLVEKDKLTFNKDNYDKLKLHFATLHLTFATKNVSAFFDLFSELHLSELELIELLEKPEFDISHKIKITERFEAENAITEIKALTLIGNLNFEQPALKLSATTLSSILLKSLIKLDKKIALYMRNIPLLDNDFITVFLNSLGGDYKQLNEKGPMPSFKKSDSLVIFFDHLKQIGKISKTRDKGDKIKVTTYRRFG